MVTDDDSNVATEARAGSQSLITRHNGPVSKRATLSLDSLPEWLTWSQSKNVHFVGVSRQKTPCPALLNSSGDILG